MRRFEIRDPIYRFVILEKDELPLLNHPTFQRLRHIRQLGPTYLVYPGANHTRFEHSLGVMHLSSMVFDRMWGKGLKEYITDKDEDEDRRGHEMDRKFYRQALRLAAMLHDLGHAPFSHAGEGVMPELESGKRARHEHYTVAAILETGIADIIRKIGNNERKFGSQRGEDMLRTVLNAAADPEVLDDLGYPEELRTTDRATMVINEILTGELGTDRMDYLLRDSHYTGTRYGEFDYWRLIDTLMVVPEKKYREWGDDGPYIGVSTDGLHVAEALIIARYHMFLQVYFHKTRRILDHHYSKLLEMTIGEFPRPTKDGIKEYLIWDDPKIISWFRTRAQKDPEINKEYERLFLRKHFRLYKGIRLSDSEKTVEDRKKDWKNGKDITDLKEGVDYYIDDSRQIYGKESYMPGGMEFPVYDSLENEWGRTPRDYSRLAKGEYHILICRLYLDPCNSKARFLLEEKFGDKDYSFCNENQGGKP